MGRVVVAKEVGNAVCLTILYIHVGGKGGEVYKGHIVVLVCHIARLYHIVIGVIAGRHAVALGQCLAVAQGEVVAQVVPSISANISVGEILSADGTHHNGLHSHGLCLVDVFPDVVLVGARGSGTAVIG